MDWWLGLMVVHPKAHSGVIYIQMNPTPISILCSQQIHKHPMFYSLCNPMLIGKNTQLRQLLLCILELDKKKKDKPSRFQPFT